MKEQPSLLKLFLYFLKVGALTFGGGYAIIATLEKELVDDKNWISHDDMLNMIVVGESTPGPIAINLATFIGYKMHGFWGSFFCTLGFVIPSFTIIVLISVALQYITEVPEVVRWLFKGIRAGVVVLIGNAATKFFSRMVKKTLPIIVFLTAFFVEFFTNISAIYLILIGGVVGLFYTFIVSYITKKKQGKVDNKCIELDNLQCVNSHKKEDNKQDITENNSYKEIKDNSIIEGLDYKIETLNLDIDNNSENITNNASDKSLNCKAVYEASCKDIEGLNNNKTDSDINIKQSSTIEDNNTNKSTVENEKSSFDNSKTKEEL